MLLAALLPRVLLRPPRRRRIARARARARACACASAELGRVVIVLMGGTGMCDDCCSFGKEVLVVPGDFDRV